MSSSQDSFQKYSIADEPDKELYSPFLNEALFTDEEANEEWEMRLMELQTPFLESFEEGYEFSTEIEEEESESSYYKMDDSEFDENQTFDPYFLEKEEVLEEEEFELSDYEIDNEEFADDEILEDESESTYYEIDEEEFDEDETFDSYLLGEEEALEDEESELSDYEMDEEEFDE
ncbi:MAG: hypothetical protein WBM44_07595, partial [Waterburya sp.]